MMLNSWLVLLPPLLVLTIAIVKRNVILSLLTGIVSAALIATNFSLIDSILLILRRIYDETNIKSLYDSTQSSAHLYTFGFLIFLGIIISLITHSGGIAAYSKILRSKLKDKKTTETTSLLFSLVFFIDDYLNSLTIGCVMRPLTDSLKIPRAKLAYLIDSMSPSLCVLVPASSWVAFILSQLENSGIKENISNNISSKIQVIADAFNVYLHSIPYMLYPITLIASTWFIVRYQISFGLMRRQEIQAIETGNLFGGKDPIILRVKECKTAGSIWNFIIPIGTFLSTVIFLLLSSGGWVILGGTRNLGQAFLQADPFFSLFFASLISLIISITYLLFQKNITVRDLKDISIGGFDLMKNSLIVLLLAWTLGTLLDKDLSTGQYLAQLLFSVLPSFTLPLTIFVTSIIISASTGSAWGTIAIITPLAIPAVIAFTKLPAPVSLEQAQLLFPVVGALISGAIAGAHISPISDATVISSTSAGSYHLDHVWTQMEYVLAPIIGTAIALLSAGLLAQYNPTIVIPTAIILSISLSFTILYIRNKHSNT